MKILKFVFIASQLRGKGWDAKENMLSFSKVIDEGQKKYTSAITAICIDAMTYINTKSLTHVSILIYGDNGKHVEVKYSTDLFKLVFDIYKAIPYLDVFEDGHRKIDAERKSSNAILLNIASTFKLKRQEVTLNQYLYAIELRIKFIQDKLFIDNQETRVEVLGKEEMEVMGKAAEIRTIQRQEKKLLAMVQAQEQLPIAG